MFVEGSKRVRLGHGRNTDRGRNIDARQVRRSAWPPGLRAMFHRLRPLLLASSSLLGACAHHVKLVTPDTSPASAYECGVEVQCQPASILDDARLNQSGTAFVALPKECRGRFQQIVILDADSSHPTVVATCAAPDPSGVPPMTTDPTTTTDGPIGEM